jgi:hypothetical protein
MNIIKIAVLGALLSCWPRISIAQGYRGIVPLHSTCEDVKRILGVATCDPANEFHEFRDESVRITFSKKTCDVAFGKAWNVQPGTVLIVERLLKRRIPLSDLKIDLSRYKKQPLNNDINTVVYESLDEGLSYWTTNDVVATIYHVPSSKDAEFLRCNQPETNTIRNKFDLPAFPFDRYGDLSSGEEQQRLNLLVQELKEHPTGAQIYIVVYTDQRLQKEEAQVRAQRAKDYLTQAHGIKAGRIKTIVEDQRQKFEVVIYIVQPDSH